MEQEIDEPEEVDSDDEEMEEEIWKAMKKSMPKEKGDPLDLDEEEDPEAAMDGDDDDDEDLAAYDYSESDAEDGDEEEVPYKSPFADEAMEEEGDDAGFLEEDDDLLGSDQDIPLYGDSDDDDSGEGEEEGKGKGKGGNKNKKRKLKHLPLFATADDYAKLLGGSDDEDI